RASRSRRLRRNLCARTWPAGRACQACAVDACTVHVDRSSLRARTTCKERGGLNRGQTSDVSRSPRLRWDAGDVPGLPDVDVTEANCKTLVEKYLGAMRRI